MSETCRAEDEADQRTTDEGSLERDWLIYGGAISAVKLNALVINREKFSGSSLPWVHVRMSWLVFKHVMTGV